jgi:hypothetical protein
MQVKNKKGEIEGMGYDAAQAAVTAGTHTFVNVEEKDGKLVPKAEKAKEPHPPEPDSIDTAAAAAPDAVREVHDAPATKKSR